MRSLLLPAALGLFITPAFAQSDLSVESVTVTGDRVHLIELKAEETAFGIAKPLLETPRAITVISDTTLARYGVKGVDTLTAITPSAYTASYYGVEGAVNLRGTLAESYFRGFKRAENRGTYQTPLGDAAQVEILRGPPSPIYGAGKVGGLLNFIPKSGRDVGDAFSGNVTASYGSYSKRNVTGQAGLPFALGSASGGLHAYGEVDDSYSYYRGIHPSHQLLEVSGDLTTGAFALSADYMFYHANGDVQTPGWNRLTQNLIDGGAYITGRNTSLKDTDGNGRLTLNELGGNPYYYDPSFQPLYLAAPYCGTCTDATHRLDTGLGTTTITRRTVYTAPGVDFSNTITHTGFAEAAYGFDDGSNLKLQLFADTLSNDRFVSYGFPGSYRTQIAETRLRYDFTRADFGGRLTSNTVVGGSYRYVHAIGKESYNSGVIALDRRDITLGARPNDLFDSPFNSDPVGTVGLGWENDVRTNSTDAGLFVTSDIALDHGLNLVVGGRYDAYNVRSVDVGLLPYEAPSGRGAKGAFTYSASLSYKTDLGLVPYITNAKSSALEIGQASQVMTSLLASGEWLSTSTLNEAGVKFTFLDNHLVGSLDWYAQDRTQLRQTLGAVSVMGTRSKGLESEIRAVLDQNFSFTLAASLQHTTIKGPDHSFQYIPARAAGVAPALGFGGSYVVWDFAGLKPGDYENTLVPHAVISPYATFTSDDGDWGVTLGGTYVTRTVQTVPNGLTFPAYIRANASGFWRYGPWQIDVNVNNLSSTRYFTPDADTYANLGALPGMGRTWRIGLTRNF